MFKLLSVFGLLSQIVIVAVLGQNTGFEFKKCNSGPLEAPGLVDLNFSPMVFKMTL